MRMAMEQERLEQLLATKTSVEEELLKRPGVHGVSISPKIVDGESTGELAITIHVSKKLPLDSIPANQRVAKEIGGFVTDVVEHEQPAPHVDGNKYRPLQAGCQIQFSNWFGTLGAFVTSNNDSPEGTLLLTNRHVLPSGGDVFQPDNGKGNKVGTVTRGVLSSDVDGAVAQIVDTSVSNTIIGVGVINGTRNLTVADIGLNVRKRGRTTELTSGGVISIAYSGTRTDGWAFRNQIRIDGGTTPFSQPGDSGSSVVDANCRVVGLLWGGGGNFGVASPIAAVQSQLSVTVVAGGALRAMMLPIRDNAQLHAHVQQQLADSADGAALLDFWNAHHVQLIELVHHHKRVLSVWKRHHGDDILGVLANALQDDEAHIPEYVGGVSVREALEKIGEELLLHGDERLKRDLPKLRPIFDRIFAKPSLPPMRTLRARRLDQ
jgi:hypothetical protein